MRCYGKEPREAAARHAVAQGHRLRRGHQRLHRARSRCTPSSAPCSAASTGTPTNIDADIVHLHTWYTHFGGILAKLNYGIPMVLTVHSLEPLRPWKREQLGGGYDFSCWVEKTAIEMADAVIAVSHETKADILRFFDVPRGAHPHHLQRHRPRRIQARHHHRTRWRNTASIPPCRSSSSSAASRGKRASSISSAPSSTWIPASRSCSAPARPTRRRSPRR